jgi:hypothetical protein
MGSQEPEYIGVELLMEGDAVEARRVRAQFGTLLRLFGRTSRKARLVLTPSGVVALFLSSSSAVVKTRPAAPEVAIAPGAAARGRAGELEESRKRS